MPAKLGPMNATDGTQSGCSQLHGRKLRGGGGLIRLLPLAVAVSLIQSCATMPVMWAKPGAEPGTASREVAECRTLAADLMWRMTWEDMWPPSFYDPRFMPPFYRGTKPFWLGAPDSLELEQSLIDFCMHSKGYRLSALPQ